MNNDARIYYIVRFNARRSDYAFCGANAKRDAHALARSDPGKVIRMTGAQWNATPYRR